MNLITLISAGWKCTVLLMALRGLSTGHAENTIVYGAGPLRLHQAVELDLDADGVPDFRFTAGVLAGLPNAGFPSTQTPFLDTFSYNRNDYPMTQGRIILKAKGIVFGPDLDDGLRWTHRDFEAQRVSDASSGQWSGFAGSPLEAFLGVRFLSGGKHHFGWIRFALRESNAAGNKIQKVPVILDWAWEKREGTAIMAGAKASSGQVNSPEPSR